MKKAFAWKMVRPTLYVCPKLPCLQVSIKQSPQLLLPSNNTDLFFIVDQLS